MQNKLEWHSEVRKVRDLALNKANPRKVSKEGLNTLKERIRERGYHEGEEFMNDFVENKIKKAIDNGDMATAKFWASRRDPRFRAEKPAQTRDVVKSKEELENQRFQAKMNEPANVPKSVVKRIHEQTIKEANEALAKIEKEIEEKKKKDGLIT